MIERRIESGQLWMWEVEGRPVSWAGSGSTIEGVSCVGPVHTPPEHRRQGFAGACVRALSEMIVAQGALPMLYTDLANPTSNSIYRRIGYRSVIECIAYDFAQPRPAKEAAGGGGSS